MEKLMKKLGISNSQNLGQVLRQLEEKQAEYQRAIDNATDELEVMPLEQDLEKIKNAISTISWLMNGSSSDITQDVSDKQNGGDNEEQLKKALAMLAASECQKGVAELERLANDGYVKAQSILGQMYYTGEDGIECNYNKALKWLEKAAENEDGQAMYTLGIMYQDGAGVQQNVNMATAWFQKAANEGHIMAKFCLFDLLYLCQGESASWNYEKALELARELDCEGVAGGSYGLGLMLQRGHGVEANESEAKRLYKKAAEEGHIDALLRYVDMVSTVEKLGCLSKAVVQGCKDADERIRDYIKEVQKSEGQVRLSTRRALFASGGEHRLYADSWVTGRFFEELASKRGKYRKNSCAALAFCYAYGFLGYPIDHQKALEYIERSKKNRLLEDVYDYRSAEYLANAAMAKIYAAGICVPRDDKEAFSLFSESRKYFPTIEPGATAVKMDEEFADFYFYGRGGAPKDMEKAFEMYGAHKRANILLRVAELYATGVDVEKDEAVARTLYRYASLCEYTKEEALQKLAALGEA